MSRKIIAILLLIVGLGSSCFVAWQRLRAESRNRAVEIVLDYSEIQDLAAASGMSVKQIARKFKEAGATSVAISEQTMGVAIDNRLITPYGAQRYAVVGNNAERIAAHLRMALPKLSNRIISTPLNARDGVSFSYLTLDASIPMEYIEQVPVGLPQDAIKTVCDAGLIPVARLVNYSGASPRSINAILNDVRANGIQTVIFSGDQVLGFKGAVKNTARSLHMNDLNFGRVEFSKQKGELTFADTAPGNVITVHSITQSEMPTLDMPSIIERFQKAVRERGVRMVYVRMYDTASADLVTMNAEYVNAIARAIRRGGYALKPAHPMDELAVPRYFRMIAGVGVAAGAMLLIFTLVDLSAGAAAAWSILLIAICAGLPAIGAMGQKAVALLSALVFPVLAVVNATKGAPDSPKTMPMPYMRALGRFAVAVITVAAGGMLIVGLLSARDFMLRVDQFAGVKLAHLLPVLVVAILYGCRVAWTKGTWQAQKEKFLGTLKEIAANPMLIWQVALMAVMLVLVGIMVTRSGNDSGVGVSSIELKFRAILDKVLYVRPRTKEFLIGYPALIVGIAFALKGRRSVAAPLVVIGSIGLISALNTFCHIHTPIALSLIRVANGAIVGGLIGLIVCRIVRGRADA
ncbi:MAG: DUF5693 family protein [Armatimonadota bacterium]|nr:DUF5693 family protein [bacterium]